VCLEVDGTHEIKLMIGHRVVTISMYLKMKTHPAYEICYIVLSEQRTMPRESTALMKTIPVTASS
jgi:hypothetical protein